jgi:hypothetical protein
MILKLGDVSFPRHVVFLGPLVNMAHLNHELSGSNFSPNPSGWLFSISSSIRWNNVGWGYLTLIPTKSDLLPVSTDGDLRSWGPW